MITKSLTGCFTHVWSQDPALERADAEKLQVAYKKFLESGQVSDLPLREGQQPTLFEIGRLSRKQWLRLGQMRGFERDCEVVAYGLRSVTGFKVDGETVAVDRVDAGDGQKRVSAECLDKLYDFALFGELAERILTISTISPLSGSG